MNNKKSFLGLFSLLGGLLPYIHATKILPLEVKSHSYQPPYEAATIYNGWSIPPSHPSVGKRISSRIKQPSKLSLLIKQLGSFLKKNLCYSSLAIQENDLEETDQPHTPSVDLPTYFKPLNKPPIIIDHVNPCTIASLLNQTPGLRKIALLSAFHSEENYHFFTKQIRHIKGIEVIVIKDRFITPQGIDYLLKKLIHSSVRRLTLFVTLEKSIQEEFHGNFSGFFALTITPYDDSPSDEYIIRSLQTS